MDGRTRDGLPLTLGVSFQYRLLTERLFDLYDAFEYPYVGQYEKVYKKVGIHMITELATKFTAYQFFNEKQKIAEFMKNELDKYFQAHLFATIESLQINEDDLPDAFTATILRAATSKQNITRQTKVQEARVIEFQTARIVARAQANVTVQHAYGNQHRILQNGEADAAIIDAFVQAEKMAYGQVHREMGLSSKSLLEYIWYDTLAGGGVSHNAGEQKDIQMLVGVSPSAYISNEGSR